MVKMSATLKVFTPHPTKLSEPSEHFHLIIDPRTTEKARDVIDRFNDQQGP